MKAVFRNQSVAHHALGGAQERAARELSPEHSDSAASGAYFRAVRPTDAEAAALAKGEPVLDCDKLDRLRFAIEADLWQADPEVIAQRMIDDAG